MIDFFYRIIVKNFSIQSMVKCLQGWYHFELRNSVLPSTIQTFNRGTKKINGLDWEFCQINTKNSSTFYVPYVWNEKRRQIRIRKLWWNIEFNFRSSRHVTPFPWLNRFQNTMANINITTQNWIVDLKLTSFQCGCGPPYWSEKGTLNNNCNYRYGSLVKFNFWFTRLSFMFR